MTPIRKALPAAALMTSLALAGIASAAPLPGGASSLLEIYDDWSVACQMQADAPACVVRQAQTNSQTQQNVLTIEIGQSPNGAFPGVVLLPLGLALAQGAQFKIDDAALDGAMPFSTCIPQGCLVPFSFDVDTVAKLRVGKALAITIAAINPPQPVAMAVSLKGLDGALNRVAELTK
jgi:invasion protein IalB